MRRRGLAIPAMLLMSAVAARGASIEQTLGGTVEVSVDRVGVGSLFSQLAEKAGGMNRVVNWTALKEAGVTRETVVSARLHGVTLEGAIRAVIEAVGWGKLNYSVGDGAVEVTTNAEIGKRVEARLYDLKGVLKLPTGFAAGSGGGKEQQVLWGVFASALMRVGEVVEGGGRALKIDGNVMGVTTSVRGQAAVQRALFLLGNPARPGTFPPGSAVSVAQRKGEEGWKRVLGGMTGAGVATDLSAPALAGLSVVVGPVGKGEEMGSVVDGSGVVIIGAKGMVREPMVMGVFDVRELLKRLAQKSGRKGGGAASGDFSEAVVAGVKQRVSGEWGELGKAERSVGAYHGEVVVFAPASVVREVSLALQEMMK
ncbi:MAG: hypothetical protein ACTHN5_16020 [Phycisphaerae bacterium]